MNSASSRSFSNSPLKIPKKTFVFPSTNSLSPARPSKTLSLIFRAHNDENDNRTLKVQQQIDIFQSQLAACMKKETFYLKELARESVEDLYKKTLEHIFTLYNVSTSVILQDQSDSAMRIEPLIHPGKAVYVLTCIAHLLVKLPYSFIRLIDLNKFSVCKNMHLKKEEYESLYTSRMMSNAMFSLHEHKTYEKIERHFYKIVLYHMKKKMPSIDTDWPKEKPIRLEPLGSVGNFSPNLSPTRPDLRKISSNIEDIINTSPREKLSGKKGKYNLQEMQSREQLETFYRVMKKPKETFESPNVRVSGRSRFFREQWECIDPVGINEEFWKNLSPVQSELLEKLSGYLVL